MLGRNLKDAISLKSFLAFTPSRAEMNLLSPESVKKWLKQHSPDVIIHCAGHVGGIHANMADPFGFLTRNLDMGINLIRAAHELGLPRLLNVGSSCMYPRDISNPLREDAMLTGRLEPTNEGYALAKIVTAKLCEYIAGQFPGFFYRTVIPCNLYGRYDHFEASRSHLVPAVIQKVHQARVTNASSIELWGDGTARREFMFAEDAAKMILACAERLDDLPQYMNLGLGHDFSVLEYYQAAADVVGWSGKFDFDLSKPTGMKQKLVDVSLQQSLGLKATTSLPDGLRQTYRYFLDSQENHVTH